jgi:hypothetical protein
MTYATTARQPGSPTPAAPAKQARSLASIRPAPDLTPRRGARIAGLGYVLIYLLAIFANFAVLEGLVVDGDAAATTANVIGSLGLLRLAVVAFLAVFLLDVVVAWALHVVFRGVHRDLSLLTAWSRLTYTVFLGVGLVFVFQVLQLTGSDAYAALGAEQISAQVLLALASFDTTWVIGLAVFGLHLVLLGVMVLRSRLAPRAVGVLLVAAGVAYAADTVVHALAPHYSAVAPVMLALVAVPSMIGEGWLAVWLLTTRRLGR